MGRSDCLASPAAASALALYAAVDVLRVTGQALPWCPLGLSAHAIPASPGGPPMAWQQWRPSEHRSPSPDNGVDALDEFTRLPLGSLHATACAVACSPP